MTIFELARRLPDIYLKASPEEKVKLLAITASNFTLLPASLTPTYRKPFDRIAEGRDCQTMLGSRDFFVNSRFKRKLAVK